MNTQNTQLLSVYIESNPNPNSLKFVVNYMLVKDGEDFDFDSKEAAKASPLATKLFDFPFVRRVFFMANFVTVTKDESVEWDETAKQIKETIVDHLKAGKPILDMAVLAEERQNVDTENEPELHKKIKGILDEYVRPAVETDGGAINFAAYKQESKTVQVELRGSCSGCPSSTYTLKAGIENLLKRFLPQDVEQVEAIEL